MVTKSFNAPSAKPQMALPGFGAETRGERHRLFFALVPGDAVRAEISRAAEQLKSQQHPRGSWIAPERYHVTLHFLGDNSELRPELVDRASMAAAKIHLPAFSLVFDSAASFRSPTPPWVLRCPEPAGSIRQLWQALSVALVGERIRTESASAFTPHITVLRDADKALASCAIDPIVWPVQEFVLIHSQLGRERRYTELGRWSLSSATKALAMNFAISHNAAQSRFETIVEGNLCVIDYRLEGDIVYLTHVGVPRPVGNRGIAAALTQAAFDWARAEGMQVVPVCPYVIAWLKRHRDYQELVRAPQ